MERLISLKDITFEYTPDTPVLNGLSLDLMESDRLALIGPNGSGKSTLFYLILGLQLARSGRIEIFGGQCTSKTDFAKVRGPLGLLFQNSDDQLFCPSVEEELAFGPLNLGIGESETEVRVREALRTVGLNGYEERVPFELSGGEKRLVALASVLTMKPRVLLLDEPGAGLDHDARARVLNVLKSFAGAMIIISHDDSILDSLCNRRVTLDGGMLRES